MNHVLLKNSEKYGGKYVATRSFKDRKVISYGNEPDKVYNEAKEKGVKEPVVFYIPKKNSVQIY